MNSSKPITCNFCFSLDRHKKHISQQIWYKWFAVSAMADLGGGKLFSSYMHVCRPKSTEETRGPGLSVSHFSYVIVWCSCSSQFWNVEMVTAWSSFLLPYQPLDLMLYSTRNQLIHQLPSSRTLTTGDTFDCDRWQLKFRTDDCMWWVYCWVEYQNPQSTPLWV